MDLGGDGMSLGSTNPRPQPYDLHAQLEDPAISREYAIWAAAWRLRSLSATTIIAA